MPPSKTTPNGDRNDTPSPTEEPVKTHSKIVDIDATGDVILHLVHEVATSTQSHRFRVNTDVIKNHSKYFAGLLSGRFGESDRVAKEHERLQRLYKTPGQAPGNELPTVRIEDVGRISTVKSIEPLCTDFLLLLHGRDLQSTPPVANLANLAVVADRFDALEIAQEYARRKRLIRSIDAKTTPKIDAALSEEKIRQRVLVALLLDYSPWLEKYTLRLMVKGWTGREPDDSRALWWDLPSRLEEELAVRRNSVLETLQSLQSYFIRLYVSRDRQCRLGYDSSAQCDSFQLGEIIRFFTRADTLMAVGTICDNAEKPQTYAGDIIALIDKMRQVPEYQIDRHHTHCGVRTRLVPLLNFLEDAVSHVGICADCWSTKRIDTAWIHTRPPLIWRRSTFRWQNPECKDAHGSARALFTATERDWTS